MFILVFNFLIIVVIDGLHSTFEKTSIPTTTVGGFCGTCHGL